MILEDNHVIFRSNLFQENEYMKCLGVDYDGTLKRNGIVSERNLEAIKKFRNEGHLFGIVSGRSLESMLKEIKAIGLEIDFLVTNNGGVIAEVDGTLKEVSLIRFDAVLELIQYIRSIDCISYVLNDGVRRSKSVINVNVKDEKYGNMDTMLNEAEILNKGKVSQIVISLENNEHNHEYADYINQHFGEDVEAYPNINCVDIVCKGVSKAAGMRKVCNRLNIPYEEVAVAGDNYNDLSMLEAFEGYTFAECDDEIKAAANGIVDEVADVIELLMERK